MPCTFVLGLPQYLRQLLQVSSRMDTMIVGQLVDRMWTIMIDTEEPEEIAAVTQPAHENVTSSVISALDLATCPGIACWHTQW